MRNGYWRGEARDRNRLNWRNSTPPTAPKTAPPARLPPLPRLLPLSQPKAPLASAPRQKKKNSTAQPRLLSRDRSRPLLPAFKSPPLLRANSPAHLLSASLYSPSSFAHLCEPEPRCSPPSSRQKLGTESLARSLPLTRQRGTPARLLCTRELASASPFSRKGPRTPFDAPAREIPPLARLPLPIDAPARDPKLRSIAPPLIRHRLSLTTHQVPFNLAQKRRSTPA